MLSETMSGGAALSENKKLCASKSRRRGEGETPIPVQLLRRALADCAQESAALGHWNELRLAMREVGEVVGQLSRSQAQSPLLGEARTLLLSAIKSGGHEIGVDAQDVTMAQTGLGDGWPGLISAMFFAPAWELSGVPALGEVPDWLWGDYAAWLFAVPRNSTQRDIGKRYSKHVLPHLEELNRWVARNVGSAAVRSAVEGYVSAISGCAWHGVEGNTRRHAELRGRILTRFFCGKGEPYAPMLTSRDSRVLRVAFIAPDFGPRTETYTALACFEKLDPQGFEVFLFSFRESESLEAQACLRPGIFHEVLPEETEARVQRLRRELFDVIVFCSDLGNTFDGLTQLALYRMADLQVANSRNGHTSGLPEIDLYISGAQQIGPEATGLFTERLALLRGAFPVYAFPKVEASVETSTPREKLGLPECAPVLATLVSASDVSTETLEAWSEILSGSSGSRLVIGLGTGKDHSPVNPSLFCARVEVILSRSGIATDRVSIFPFSGDVAEEARTLLRVADLYIDSMSGIDSSRIAEALALGVPALVLNQSTGVDQDAGVRLLNGVNLSDLIAEDVQDYVRKSVALANDSAGRDSLKVRLKDELGNAPVIFDSLAAADSFGALLENAFDELVALKSEVFRTEREPLRCYGVDDLAPGLEAGFAAHAAGDMDSAAFEANLALRSDPTNPSARHLRGLMHLAHGNAARAVDYLMAALPNFSADANYWYTVASALRMNRQFPQALEALETCLRIDGKHVDSLLMIVELAEQLGAAEIANEALQCLQTVAPENPRVRARE